MSRTPLTPLTGSEPVLLGVASTLAERLRLDPIAVRLAFVALGVAGGAGLALYVILWLLKLPPRASSAKDSSQPALSRTFGLVLITMGVLLMLRDRTPGFADRLVWPTALAACGLMLAWHQLLPTGRANGDSRPGAGMLNGLLRVGGGIVLLGAGLSYLLAANLTIGTARDAVAASVAVAGGLLLMFGPWAIRLTHTAASERTERIRADERAEMAAHLHDSVLQTLTLMQKRASDPAEMAALARRQERELRRWLYSTRETYTTATDRSFTEELEDVAAQVEDEHQVRVEAVTVGDTPMGERLAPVIGATREALVNAARFSGQRQISLYAQISEEAVEVFVRDRGHGFLRSAVPADRHGVSESIEGRLHRAGGTAMVRSTPGEGTEVQLHLPTGAT